MQIPLNELRRMADVGDTSFLSQMVSERGRVDSPYPAQQLLMAARACANAQQERAALRYWRQFGRARTLSAAELQECGYADGQAWAAEVRRFCTLMGACLRRAIDRACGPDRWATRELFRINRAISGLSGEAIVVPTHPQQRPKVLYVPGLGESAFYDVTKHPFAQALATHAPRMREEFLALENNREVALRPFLDLEAVANRDEYIGGEEGKASWDAAFFWRHGKRYDDIHRLCPYTSQQLEQLDLCEIEHQAPEICFSVMQPSTIIQPHHGVTNARLVVHIPLIVPNGCYLELPGIGKHFWREGEPMVFDDTYLHRAENPTDSRRVILLMDCWHPSLTSIERQAFKAVIGELSIIDGTNQ